MTSAISNQSRRYKVIRFMAEEVKQGRLKQGKEAENSRRVTRPRKKEMFLQGEEGEEAEEAGEVRGEGAEQEREAAKEE